MPSSYSVSILKNCTKSALKLAWVNAIFLASSTAILAVLLEPFALSLLEPSVLELELLLSLILLVKYLKSV